VHLTINENGVDNMTKKQKEYNNRYALDLWDMCESVIRQGIVIDVWSKRLAYCRATVTAYADARDKDYKPVVYILTSYNTPVACVIFNGSTAYGVDMLRKVYGYTSTSAQHIAKFFKHYVDYISATKGIESIKLRYYP
jgi:hypothetical protein